MSTESNRNLLGFTFAGFIGVLLGAGSMIYAQKSADTAENQYYMELDLLRLQTIVDEGRSFEEKLTYLELLKTAKDRGFRPVFEKNLEKDIETTRAALNRIREAEKRSQEDARQARAAEESRAIREAQEQKEKAVRTNPRIFEECMVTPGLICP